MTVSRAPRRVLAEKVADSLVGALPEGTPREVHGQTCTFNFSLSTERKHLAPGRQGRKEIKNQEQSLAKARRKEPFPDPRPVTVGARPLPAIFSGPVS